MGRSGSTHRYVTLHHVNQMLSVINRIAHSLQCFHIPFTERKQCALSCLVLVLNDVAVRW